MFNHLSISTTIADQSNNNTIDLPNKVTRRSPRLSNTQEHSIRLSKPSSSRIIQEETDVTNETDVFNSSNIDIPIPASYQRR